MNFSARIKRLQHALHREMIDVFFICDSISLYYFTGLSLSRGILLVFPEKAVLFVDGRYTEYARAVQNVEIANLTENGWRKRLENHRRVGLEGDVVSFAHIERLQSTGQNLQIISLPLVKQLRMIKDFEELACLEKSAKLLWKAFCHIFTILKTGITEKEVVLEFTKYCLEHGAQCLAFDPIIAFGKGSSMPHYHSENTVLEQDSIVLVDIGVVVDHYASDMTRTFFYGKSDPVLKQAYELVAGAQEKALELCRPGINIKDIDLAVHDYFRHHGVEEYYVHGLGHGIGLETHEPPFINYKNTAEEQLQENMVVTIEPGLYYPKKGGIRIEDMIQITADGYQSFTPKGRMP